MGGWLPAKLVQPTAPLLGVRDLSKQSFPGGRSGERRVDLRSVARRATSTAASPAAKSASTGKSISLCSGSKATCSGRARKRRRLHRHVSGSAQSRRRRGSTGLGPHAPVWAWLSTTCSCTAPAARRGRIGPIASPPPGSASRRASPPVRTNNAENVSEFQIRRSRRQKAAAPSSKEHGAYGET